MVEPQSSGRANSPAVRGKSDGPPPGAAAGSTMAGGRAAAGADGELRRPALDASTWRDKLSEKVREAPSWLISMVFHLVLILVLSLLTLKPAALERLVQLVVISDTRQHSAELAPDTLVVQTSDPTIEQHADRQFSESDIASQVDAALAELDAAPLSIPLEEMAASTLPSHALIQPLGLLGGEGLEGRGARQKPSAVFARGGSAASERAVAAALKWIAAHQLPDGGWSFDLRLACKEACPNHGSLQDARNAATALALLPLLGAGQTHREGKYRQNVQAGLSFLARRMQRSSAGGSFHEPGGAMYSHGLASIALCEDYAMTHDPAIYPVALQAVQFIVHAQDPSGGGWRYDPGQPGDTSVVGWQVMALKSAHLGQIEVPGSTIRGVELFLNSVQSEGGTKYGYLTPLDEGSSRPATTAIGLLCRMYLGWTMDHAALAAGVRHLDALGPSMTADADMYYNYYATQVMHHHGGEEWKRWNRRMRDFLVETQETQGHAAGSWHFGDPHGANPGGRLYSTAMACMILEIYYRYMPLYAKQALELEFPVR